MRYYVPAFPVMNTLHQVFRRLTAVDVVGALIAGYFSPDMLLIGETLSSVPRYCICDFFNNKYYELSHNEAKWIQLFNRYHPEDQKPYHRNTYS